MTISGEMGVSEYLRRSVEPLERGRSESPVRSVLDATGARRSTPMPDRFVPRRSQSERPSSLVLPEDEQASVRPGRPSPGLSPVALSTLRRQGSDTSNASNRSAASTGSLLDTGLEGLPPERQAWLVQCVVGDIAAEDDWLALAVFLAVAGQYMTAQVGDVALGPVRMRLADHIRGALRQLAAGNADIVQTPAEDAGPTGADERDETSSHSSARGLRAAGRHLCCGGKGKFAP